MYRELFIRDFALLGESLKKSLSVGVGREAVEECIRRAFLENDMFTEKMQRLSIEVIADSFLQQDILEKWTLPYTGRIRQKDKEVLVVMAGNIPLVGFHDFLTVMASGCKVIIKCSSKDRVLLPFIVNLLCDINSFWKNRISFTFSIEINTDIVIATGSDVTAGFFRKRFAGLPVLTRGSRYSAALLYGDESEEELGSLSKDIFYYFGLGCRSVSLLFVPEGYDLEKLKAAFANSRGLLDGSKSYHNTYRYQKALSAMNGDWFEDGGFFLFKKTAEYPPPMSVVNIVEYKKAESVYRFLTIERNSLQCFVGNKAHEKNKRVVAENKGEKEREEDVFNWPGYDSLPEFTAFGMSQYPSVREYADGVNSLEFVLKNS
jgi:hypothetical protein